MSVIREGSGIPFEDRIETPPFADRPPVEQLVAERTEQMVGSLLSSYEERVSCMGAMLDSTLQVLQESQNPLAGMHEERERINAELRERLAKTNSLRRKDFDRMMQDLHASQQEQEAEMRKLLNDYLVEQKAIAQNLRDNLALLSSGIGNRESGTGNPESRVPSPESRNRAAQQLRSLIAEAPARQEQCRVEMKTKLEQFREKQEALIAGLRELLARGEDLRIRDFKLMLGRFQADRAKRLARRQQRRAETATLLNEFREERAVEREERRKAKGEIRDFSLLPSPSSLPAMPSPANNP